MINQFKPDHIIDEKSISLTDQPVDQEHLVMFQELSFNVLQKNKN